MARMLDLTLSRRQLFAVTGVGATAVVLAACSANPQANGGGGGAGGPSQGGVFTYAMPGDIETTFDIHGGSDSYWLNSLSPMYSTLLTFNTTPQTQATLELVPDLAEDWSVSDDGLTYTFRLRKNAKWHDIEPVSGRPVTSDDVIATFEDILERGATGASMLEHVADMQAPDDHTVVITLDRPHAAFPMYLAKFDTAIVSREFVDRAYDIETQVIGSGPFMLSSHRRGEELIRARNPEYYIKGRPYLDEYNIVVIRDLNGMGAALLSRQIDTSMIPEADVERFRETDGMNLIDGIPTTLALWMNQARPPFNDLRVRRAVSLAIDWEGLGDTLFPDAWTLSSAVPPAGGDYALSPDEIKKVRPFDPEESRRLLAEAGYPDGFDTTMLVTELSPRDVPSSEYMVQDLGEVGIRAELRPTDLATANERLENGDFDLGRRSRPAGLPDLYLDDFQPGGRLNYAGIDDSKLSDMIEESETMTDERDRIEKFHDIQRYIETEISSAVYGISWWQSTGVWDHVHDYMPNIHGSSRLWTEAWVDS